MVSWAMVGDANIASVSATIRAAHEISGPTYVHPIVTSTEMLVALAIPNI